MLRWPRQAFVGNQVTDAGRGKTGNEQSSRYAADGQIVGPTGIAGYQRRQRSGQIERRAPRKDLGDTKCRDDNTAIWQRGHAFDGFVDIQSQQAFAHGNRSFGLRVAAVAPSDARHFALGPGFMQPDISGARFRPWGFGPDEGEINEEQNSGSRGSTGAWHCRDDHECHGIGPWRRV